MLHFATAPLPPEKAFVIVSMEKEVKAIVVINFGSLMCINTFRIFFIFHKNTV